ncbi:MAG: phosphodiester glycosidase family protein, partial [Clostridia bacterium]|nr:phosphodiester glycosidase family protein [Clostridia bacterium]
MTLDEKVLQLYPLISYEEDRAKDGRMVFVEQAEERELYEGVHYRKCLYRRGDGSDVWVYITTIAPDAPAQLAVSASPLRTVKMVKRHAAEFDGHVLYAMNASFFHYFNGGDLTPYGMQIMRGVEMTLPGKDKPEYSNNWVGVTKDGKAVIGNAEDFYTRWRGKLEYAVGGGMRLIRNGEVRLTNDPDHDPRTTVGIAADGTVVLLCADGRSKKSAGLTYGDVIDLYQSFNMDIREL